MPRKNNRSNPLQIKVKAVSLPKSVSAKRYLQTLVKVIDGTAALPSSWDVRLYWRNPNTFSGRTRNWQVDDFENAVSESHDGFNGIVRGKLIRMLRGL